MEAKLQKLKVTELKELLAKHDLPQTGKKDELVKRLAENNISPEGDAEELVDFDDEEANGNTNGTTESEPAPSTAPAAQPVRFGHFFQLPLMADEQEPASATTVETTTESTDAVASASTEQTLSPEEQARKARAERFGLEFKPAQPKPASAAKPASQAKSTPAETKAAPAAAPKQKAGAIDKSEGLGISEEVLAKRAAKFGLPEKKAPESTGQKAAAAPAAAAPVAAAPKAAEVQLTPEMAEKIAAEEEKKRKRAEKFGTGKPTSDEKANGSEEPDAKKAEV